MTIKPQYGFGKEGSLDKGVGANNTLVYEITMISFEKAKESWQLDADAKLEQVSRLLASCAVSRFDILIN